MKKALLLLAALLASCGGEEQIPLNGIKVVQVWGGEVSTTLGSIVIGPSPIADSPKEDGPDICIRQQCQVCQMRLYGVAIWNEVRPPSEIERKTFRIDNLASSDLEKVGGSYDKTNYQILYEPELQVLKFGINWIMVKAIRPHWTAGVPPYANGKMRIIGMAFEGSRYGRNWSCMTEDLNDGDLVLIRAEGNETVPPRVVVEAYWPLSVWGNSTNLAPNYTFFSVFGDKATLTFSR